MMDNGKRGIAIVYMLLGGFGSSLSGLMDTGLNSHVSLPVLHIITIIAGSIFMIIMYAISTALIYIIGKLLKGVATYQGIFKGNSLAYISFTSLIPVMIIWMVLDPKGFFTSSVDMNPIITLAVPSS